MANSDKNIRIITNKNKSSLPNITFTGYNNDPVVLNVLDDNTISFEGSSGQLFSISNSVTSGTIFSVNDISGIPSFRVDADGTVGIAEFSGNVGIGLQSPQSKLSVGGDINASIGYSYRINGTMVLNASSLGTGVTLSALTSVGTVSSGTWSASPVSLLYGGTGASTAAQALANLGAASAGTNTDITRLTNLQSLQVTIPAAASIGMTIKAAASQTGNFVEFLSSANARLAHITKDGTLVSGGYIAHSDGRISGVSVNGNSAPGIVVRGSNSDNNAAYEVQNNPGSLTVGLYPSGLVFGGVLQAYSTTGSTSTTTGALIVAGGAGIAGSLNTSTSFSSSISGLRILNASLSSATGTIAATNKIQVTVSDTDAFLVKNGGGTNIFDIDTSNNVISIFPSTGSTNSSTGALVVTGGVGIGGTLNARSVYVDNDLMHTPGVGNTFTNSWTSITFPSGFSASRIIYAENKFVAIGGSVVVYSSDLTNWTTSYIPWTGALSCQAIAYGNGYFAVMPSQSAYVAYSSDLSNWGIGSVTYQNYGSITYGNGRFIANSGAVVGISTNGTNWGSFTPSGNIGGGTISYHNGYFYTPSARSVDGINWESLNIPITIPQMQYGNGLYFGAQYNSANYTYSTDGLNFTSATIENNVYVGAEYHNGVYYLRTQHNVARLYYSFDGKNYQFVNTPGGINIYGMAFGKNKIVIVGATGAGSPYAYYAEGTNGKIDLNPIREGNIDNTVIGKRVPRPASFTDLSATGYANIVNQANSTSATSGALVVRGGVGIGGTLNVGSVNVLNNINYYPSTGSTGGIAWSTISLPAGVSGITKMIYANNKFVGVGNTFAVYSNDGLNWSSVNFTGFSSSENFNNLAYGNGKYVALAGSAATVALYSTDAITWTRSFLPASRVVFRGFAYGNGYFVGIDQSNIPVRSTDGINWTSASGLAGYSRDVKFINGLFIATLWLATNEDFTYTSTDGVDWTRLNVPLVISYGITYGNGKYFASSVGTTSPIVSTDLVNWTRVEKQTMSYYDQLGSPSYHNGTFYIPSNYNNIIYSNDLVNWSSVSAAQNELVYGADKLIIANGTSVLVSQSAQGKADISPFLNSSIENIRIGADNPDSATFTHLSALNNVSFTSPLNSTSTTSGALVVRGGVGIGQSVNIGGKLDVSNTINYVATNSGIANTWTRIAIPSPVSISGLTYGNGLYVGVGYSAATSTDGITWTARSLPHNLTTVGYGNGLYVGVNGGSALGATSTDGITWRSMPLPASANWDGIAYGNGVYVISATHNQNLIAYSYNGFNWTLGSISLPGGFFVLRPVIFGGGYFYTGSYAGTYNYTSIDGINWTLRTGHIAVATNQSTYGDGAWLISGSSASLSYTKDFITWTYSGHYGWSGQANYPAYTNGTFAIVDGGSLQCTLIYKNLSTVVLSNLPGPSYATTITAGEGKFVAGAGSTVYVTDVASHTYNIFPHNSGDINNVRIGAKFPSAAQFTNLSANGLVSFGATTPSISTFTGALVVKGGVGIGGSLFVGNTLSIASSTASTSSLSGALIVSGGVGISGNVNANGIIRSGQLSAPVFTISALGGTGALTPSTIYYYKLSALDYFGNESLPSNEVSISLNSSTYAVYLNPSVDYSVHKYKVFRTTTSGIYTTSLVDTFMNFKGYYNANYLGSVYVDRGKPVSAGSPLTTATANKVYLGSTDKSSLGSLNLSGQLFIQNPNASVPDSRVGIQLGQFDIGAIKDGSVQYVQSFTSATGGTLTAGTNYYYKYTTIDYYGNESLPSKEYAYTADSNGAVQINLGGGDQSVLKHRWYRTTTPGNFTNSYIGELPGYIDINYPTSNVSPPTTSTAYSYYLNSSTIDGTSYIRRLDTASGVRQLANNAYIFISGITTSGIAGTLAPNTTYYYKIAGFDRLGNLSSSSSPYPINTGPATSVQITSNGVTWINGEDGFVVWRSTSKDNFSNAPAFYVQPGAAYTDTGNYEFIGTPPTSSNFVIGDFGGYNYAFAPFYFRQIDLGAALNNTSLRVLSAPARLPEIALVSGGTLTPGAVYYYKVMGFTNGGAHGMASASVRVVVGAGGAVRLTFYVGITSAYRYYNVYRTQDLTNWTNSLVGYYISEYNFTDIGYSSTAGSPVGYGGAKTAADTILSGGSLYTQDITTSRFRQEISAPSINSITGTTGGILTTSTTYYYRIAAIGNGSNEYGQFSKEFTYTTSDSQNAISLAWGRIPGASAYVLIRSTNRNAAAGSTSIYVNDLSFVDYGYSTRVHYYDPYAAYYPGSYGARFDADGRYQLPSLQLFNGTDPNLSVNLLPPVISSAVAGTGGTLANNTNFYYLVEAYDYTNQKTMASTEIVVNTGANNAVTLTWNEKNGAFYYKVYRSSTSNFENCQINQQVYGRTFTDINYPVINQSPMYGPGSASMYRFGTQHTIGSYFGLLSRSVIQTTPTNQAVYATDYALRLAGRPANTVYGSLFELGDFQVSGYNGSINGTYFGLSSATGFTGNFIDLQSSSVSRFKVDYLGSATIGSTTGSGSTSTGALVISGGVGIGQSLFTSPSYSSSISGAIFSNGSATLSGTFTQNNSSTTAFAVRNAGGTSILNVDTTNSVVSVLASTASTNTSTGALVVTGGVGIGGTLNISGNASIGGTLNVSGTNSYFQNNLYVGSATQGRLYFSQATLGSAGTTVIPSMAFIGATNSPITLSVLPDNSLSFDGSSGQLFSINNNLSTGWIFSINDISGLPIFRTNADLTVAMGEYGGNVGIGLSNPTFKLQVSGNAGISGTTFISNTTASTNTTSGALVVSGGVGIGGSLNVSGASNISSVILNSGVITGSLSGTATTANNVNVVSALTSANHPILFTPATGTASGAAVSSEPSFVYNPSTDILSVSGLAITSGTASTTPTTGALVVSGGVGISGVLNVGSRSLSNTYGTGLLAGFAASINSYPVYIQIQNTSSNFGSDARLRLVTDAGSANIFLYNSTVGTASSSLVITGPKDIVLYPGFGGTIRLSPTFDPSAGLLVDVNSTSVKQSTGSTSTTTGALIITGGVGIGQTLFTSQSYASSISGVILNNGSTTLSGTYTQNNSNTAAFAVRNAGGTSILNVDTSNSIVSVLASTGSTNTSTGALVVNGGLGVSGQLTFSRASFGFTGITSNPTMAFIGNTTASPINLTVLTDNSLSWEGSSGQLFSIDNNLTSGEIFAVSDISGLPIISASAGQTVSLNEFGGFTRIGNGSISSTGASNTGANGTLVVYGGVGITGNTNIGGAIRAGGGSFAKNISNGDIALDNSNSDTPGVLYYWQNNKNIGTDVYFSGSGVTRYRIVKELNESGGTELWSIDREGIVYRSSWAVGETISTSMYNNSDLNMQSTNTVGITSYVTIATITYTPKSSSSYLWIEFDAHYDFNNGSTADDFFARITVGGSTIVEKNQIFVNASGGGTRSGVLFPISGRYTNTSTSGIAITVQARQGTADDSIRIYGSSTSGYMRIQEIGR